MFPASFAVVDISLINVVEDTVSAIEDISVNTFGFSRDVDANEILVVKVVKIAGVVECGVTVDVVTTADALAEVDAVVVVVVAVNTDVIHVTLTNLAVRHSFRSTCKALEATRWHTLRPLGVHRREQLVLAMEMFSQHVDSMNTLDSELVVTLREKSEMFSRWNWVRFRTFTGLLLMWSQDTDTMSPGSTKKFMS